MTAVEVFAPAKINLTLHITGQRDDGYHLLDSLVAFATVGDRLTLSPGDGSLGVTGPEAAGVPVGAENLVTKALRLVPGNQPAMASLEKNLPAASGIGGGSADAAAALRGALSLAVEEGQTDATSDDMLKDLAGGILALGADVPMCLLSRPARAQGIGEKLTFIDLPTLPMLLVNPRVPVPTGPVFQALAQKTNPPMPDAIPSFADGADLIAWLRAQRNDLQAPAQSVAPVIGEVLDILGGVDGCGLARMSGSGATCFALFNTQEEAMAGGHDIQKRFPDWWLAGGFLGNQEALAAPQLIRATT
ncbi:MAG: 4-(cytidine 5'-diphospho)-2-C-methyl-D-erythritol kinase [Silicimonas sp.]|nr:4-(cytidine 5'-diphospho)-2-C-methyl-D-erythritol kinase [Silicimonas sp.]